MGRTDLAGSMSVELISVLIAVLAIRAGIVTLIVLGLCGQTLSP